MKNFGNLKLNKLSVEELAAIKGGRSPIDPIIIKENVTFNSLMNATLTFLMNKHR